MAVDSFIFGGNTGLTYEQLKRRRAVALALASQRRGFPKTVGEGLTYLGESIGDTLAERRLDAAERAQGLVDRTALNPSMAAPSALPSSPAQASRPAPTATKPAPPPAPVRPPVAPVSPRPAPTAAALPPAPVLPSGPSSEAMTSGPPPSEFAMGGILNAAPMAAPNLEPVFPGEEGIPSQAAGILPSSGYLPPTATAAAPPPIAPTPQATAPTEPNAMDQAGWPTGPRRNLLSTETGAAEEAPIDPRGSPEWQRMNADRIRRGQQPLPVPPAELMRPRGAPAAAVGPQSSIELTPQQRDVLARTIYGEASNQADVGQQAVANVILNRARMAGTTPDYEALKRNQFEPWWNASARARMERLSTEDPAYQRAQAAIDAALGSDPTGGATHFYSPSVQAKLGRRMPSWDTGGGKMIGTHKFLRLPYGGQQPAPVDGGEGVTLAAYAPTGGVSDAPIPGMGGAGAPRLRPQIPPLQGPPPAPEETGITPTDIEPAPPTAQFGPPAGQFTRSDAPVPGIPPAGPARPPMQAGAAVPSPIEPMDPGPEPRPPAKTSEMLHYQNVASDPKYSDQTRAEAARRHDEALRAQREDFTRQWSVWKTEKLKFDDPATRLQLRQSQLANEKAVRDLEGEGFRPLTPEELKGLPTPPPGQIVYANRRGELKFGPTPPASTTVNVDTKAQGKGQEKLQEKMAEQFVEMFTAGNSAADDLKRSPKCASSPHGSTPGRRRSPSSLLDAGASRRKAFPISKHSMR